MILKVVNIQILLIDWLLNLIWGSDTIMIKYTTYNIWLNITPYSYFLHLAVKKSCNFKYFFLFGILAIYIIIDEFKFKSKRQNDKVLNQT